MPEAVSLVYWDYYHNTSAYYEQYFRMHEKLLQEGGAERLYLACGGWTFHGLAPGYTKMRETVRAGVEACRHGQVSKVFCTFWQDNGAETPLMTALYSMAVFSCACYGQEQEMVSSWCRFFTGFSEGAWMLFDRFDTMPGTVPGNVNTDNPSKYLFYQDVLLGLFDRQVETLDLTHYYGKLKQELQEAFKEKKEPDAWQLLFRYYGLLAEILEKKSELGIRLKKAYDAGDTRALEAIRGDLKACIRLVKDFRELREEIWFTESRAFGFEVLDIRLGGLVRRLKSARKRLKDYLVGNVSALEELEEPRLPFESSLQDTEHVLCACNLWEQIVTAGNLTGV